MTSEPIRLSTNFMTFIPSLTFTDYEWFPWSICNGCGMPARNAYPSGHLVPSPIVGLACAPIVETRFLELAMSLLDFSPKIPLCTFSILLKPQSHFESDDLATRLCQNWTFAKAREVGAEISHFANMTTMPRSSSTLLPTHDDLAPASLTTDFDLSRLP